MIVFGIITPKSRYDAVTLAGDLEKRSGGEWSWVLYELNRSFHAVIFGSLEMRGRVSRMKGVEVTTAGEVIESSEDNRAEWLVPRSRGGNSAHQIAAKKIADFVSSAYRGVAVKKDEDDVAAKPAVSGSTERAVVIPKRRAYKGTISAQDAKHIQKAPTPKTSSTSENKSENAQQAPGGDIARKSRRQKSQT